MAVLRLALCHLVAGTLVHDPIYMVDGSWSMVSLLVEICGAGTGKLHVFECLL